MNKFGIFMLGYALGATVEDGSFHWITRNWSDWSGWVEALLGWGIVWCCYYLWVHRHG